MRSFFVLGLLVPFVLASPLEQKRAEQVLVPGLGLVPRTNVHEVPAGASIETVGDEVQLRSSTGKVLHSSKIVSPEESWKVNKVEKRAGDGWVVAGHWTDSGSAATAIKSFTTKWRVPANPSTNHGQTLFLFNAIEPGTFNAILQPVLQWGPSAAGGGAFWAVASWYISPSNQAFFTSPVRVSVGQELTGVMTLSSVSGSVYNYSVTFTGVSGTTLAANGGAQLVWATETLESYGISTERTDYPTGTTPFYSIGMTFVTTTPAVSWQTADWDTGDALTVSIAAQGATGSGQVVVHYPVA